MKMSKLVFPNKAMIAVFILVVIAVSGYAQVNQDEMKDLPQVVFINYEGPHARVDTREEIRQLGVVLGRDIAAKERGVQPTLNAMNYEQKRAYSYRLESGANNRYFVIHNIAGAEENKLNADILGLGVDTGVDHIRNLRVILQGYLQEAYAYNANDALLLAEFITIYNAVYRGNWDFFVSRYKTPVINHLTSDKAGLSIRYDEWPGRTLILIPLGLGGLGAVDTSAITDARVIEEMRKDDDQGIPQRQAIVNLQEREAAQVERQVEQERRVIRQEERQIAAERRQTEQERQTVRDDLAAGKITEEEAAQREEELAQRESNLSQREAELDQRKEEVAELSQRAEEIAASAQAQREEIAKDQQAALTKETGAIGVSIERMEPTIMGRLVLLDLAKGVQIRRSPLDLIHTRTVTFIGGRLIAIAGENKGIGAVRLVEINQSSLEMAKQGDDDIKTGSLIWVNGNDLYAITTDLRSEQHYLGRFDTNLLMQARSTVKVHNDASVTIQQGRLLTQREDGTALMLNPTDLSEIKEPTATASAGM